MRRFAKVGAVLLVGILCFSGCSKQSKTDSSTKQAKVDVLSKKSKIATVVKAVIDNKSTDELPVADYISDDILMFHTNKGFFVFDRTKKVLTSAIDLKKTGVFSKDGSTDTKFQIAKDGSLARIYLVKGKKVLKDYYFHVKTKKLTDQKTKITDIYNEDISETKKESYAGVSMQDLLERLSKSGQGDANALFYGDDKIVYLGYPSGVFMKENNMMKNLSLVVYDVKTEKTQLTSLFKGYVSLDQETKGSNLKFTKDVRWYKQAKDGSLYFDLDELTGTKGATGSFGVMIIGNVFQTSKGTLTVKFQKADGLNTTLKPVIVLNSVDESTDPIQYDLDKTKGTYHFTGLQKDKLYYIDCYPTKDSTDDKLMDQIDKTNKKLTVTVSN